MQKEGRSMRWEQMNLFWKLVNQLSSWLAFSLQSFHSKKVWNLSLAYMNEVGVLIVLYCTVLTSYDDWNNLSFHAFNIFHVLCRCQTRLGLGHGNLYCRFASTARMLQKLPHIFFIILKTFHYYQTYKGIAFKHKIRKFGIRKTAIKTI